jgi:hypothetical protein
MAIRVVLLQVLLVCRISRGPPRSLVEVKVSLALIFPRIALRRWKAMVKEMTKVWKAPSFSDLMRTVQHTISPSSAVTAVFGGSVERMKIIEGTDMSHIVTPTAGTVIVIVASMQADIEELTTRIESGTSWTRRALRRGVACVVSMVVSRIVAMRSIGSKSETMAAGGTVLTKTAIRRFLTEIDLATEGTTSAEGDTAALDSLHQIVRTAMLLERRKRRVAIR